MAPRRVTHEGHPRVATASDVGELAQLLHNFNIEFNAPTPGAAVLEPRLARLLADTRTFALVAGHPAVAFALVTLRPNVWYDGEVALLDELYVHPDLRSRGIGSAILEVLDAECCRRGVSAIEINVDESDTDAQRFYERHGFLGYDESTGERAFYFTRNIDD